MLSTLGISFHKFSQPVDGLRTPPASPNDVRSSLKWSPARLNFPTYLRKLQSSKSSERLTRKDIQIKHAGTTVRSPKIDHVSREALNTSHSTVASNAFTSKELPPTPAPPKQPEILSPIPRKLRLVPQSYHDLRALRSAPPSAPPTWRSAALLPSPDLPEPGLHWKPETLLESQDCPVQSTRPDEHYATYEEHDIVSDYCSKEEDLDLTLKARDHPSLTRRLSTADLAQRRKTNRDVAIVGAAVSFSQSQSKKRNRSRTCSSEADWLAGKMSVKAMCEEWSKSIAPRCPQSSLHSFDREPRKVNKEDPQIMYITEPGRPKIVTISRPMSVRTSPTTRQLNSVTARPTTPPRSIKEVSAFSPDTPFSARRKSARLSVSNTILSLLPAPLTPHCKQSSPKARHDRTSSEASSRDSLSSLRSTPSNTTSYSCNTTSTSTTNLIFHLTTPPREPPRVQLSNLDSEGWARCNKLEATLDAVTEALDRFASPSGALCLDSPAILRLRSPTSLDEEHIRALSEIFPSASKSLISVLAAFLIVDIYLGRFRASQYWRFDAACQGRVTTSLTHGFPPKAVARLGIQLPDVTQVQVRERSLCNRAEALMVFMHVQSQRLMESACGRWDEGWWRTLRVVVQMIEEQA